MENGLASEEEKRKHLHPEPNFQGNEEYINLVKYISTYRDGRRRSSVAVSADGDIIDETPKKPWWAFWRKSKKGPNESTFEVPDEWLLTDIRQGLRSSDVEIRRRRAGFNELTTEKENMVRLVLSERSREDRERARALLMSEQFLKFLSYFSGPILYGKAGPHVCRRNR